MYVPYGSVELAGRSARSDKCPGLGLRNADPIGDRKRRASKWVRSNRPNEKQTLNRQIRSVLIVYYGLILKLDARCFKFPIDPIQDWSLC